VTAPNRGEPGRKARPIPQIVAELVRDMPDAPAVTCAGVTYTRSELDELSTALAHRMRRQDVGHGDFVAIAVPNSVEFYVAVIAAWKVGAIPQPISWRLPVRERDAILGLASPKVAVGLDNAPGGLPNLDVDLAGLEPGALPLPAVVSPAWKASASGGSTGRPKLILSGTPAEFDPDAVAGQALIARDQTQLVAGPLYHNSPLTYSVLGYLVGHHLVVLQRFDAATALDAITQFSIDFAVLVPTMMSRMLRAYRADPGRYNLGSLQTVWHLAAPCPAWLKEAWIELVGPERLWEVYAGTELQAATVISGTRWLEHRGSVGRVVTGEMKVVDDDGGELPAGQVGEIYMRPAAGAEPTYHYIGADARSLDGGWESLGDMGWFDDDGYLYLSDRRTDMILVGGANIYPAEIEGALDEHPAAVSSVVVGLPDDDLGNRLHAVVQTSEPVNEAELRAFVAERLEPHKRPRSYRFVTDALHDDAGKVNRSAIRDGELSAIGQPTSEPRPR
jgi:bile acid-coenzyme A ligase